MHNIYLNLIEKVGSMKNAFIPAQKKENSKTFVTVYQGKSFGSPILHQVFMKMTLKWTGSNLQKEERY